MNVILRNALAAATASALFGFGGTAFAACESWQAPSRCDDNPPLPAAVQKLIPAGYTALDHLAGALTDSGRTDYLVVIHREPDTQQQASPRPLLVIVQDADGHYRLAARNDHVVMKADEGGVSGDPYLDLEDDGLAIKNRYFSIQNGVAAGPNHWSDNITFHYDPALHTWLFHQEIFHHQDLNTSNDPNADALLPDKAKVTRANKAKPVTFEAWRPNW